MFSFLVDMQSEIKGCNTLFACSGQIFERCVGVGIGLVDQNFFNNCKDVGFT